MAFSIDLETFIITIPQNDLTHESGTLYTHDTNAFRVELKEWEDDEEGMPFLKTHNHNTEVTIVGVTYARAIEILSPYSVEYEDGQYTVILTGSNNNIFDVANGILNQNQVQVIPGNSAGLIVGSAGSGMSVEESTQLDELHKLQGLDVDNPMTVSPASRVAGTVSQTITGDGETTTTVTRDP